MVKENVKPLGGAERFGGGKIKSKPAEEKPKVLAEQFEKERKKETIFPHIKRPEFQDDIERMEELAKAIIIYIKGVEGIEIFPRNREIIEREEEKWNEKTDDELIIAAQESTIPKWTKRPVYYLALANILRRRAKEKAILPNK
jgi:hypothetical protein